MLVCRVTLVVLVVGTTCLAQSGKPCPSVSDKPSCVCKSDKGIIDLTPLAEDGNKPRYNPSQLALHGGWCTRYTTEPADKGSYLDVLRRDC